MGKRRNLKRRDNEVEGEGSGSNVTSSAVEMSMIALKNLILWAILIGDLVG